MWFDLAHQLGHPVRWVKQHTTSMEFVKWAVYLKQKQREAAATRRAELEYAAKNPSMDHEYFAQICQRLDALATGKLEQRSRYIIPFKLQTETEVREAQLTREELVAQADDFAKMKMFAVLGTPTNFEGFKT